MAAISTIGFIIPSLSPGGAERVVAVLAQGLAADFKVHVLIETGALRAYPLTGVQVHEVDFTEDGLVRAIEGLGLEVVLDHYHWDQAHVRLMARIADRGVKVVLTEHNAYHYPQFQWARDGRAGYETWFDDRLPLYARFAAVTVLNDAAHRSFARHLDNVVKLPNPAPRLKSYGADPASGRMMTVSHFRKKAKRLDLMYQVFAKVHDRLPTASLTVLGEYDAFQDRCYRLAAGLGDRPVQTVGRSLVPDRHYDSAALFALTSEIEGQPMVLLEAALHRIPQVAFDIPGLGDQVIHGETGMLVPFGDTEAFAAISAELLSDPARLRRMGQAARELVEGAFALPRILDLWRDLLARLGETDRITAPRPKLTKSMAAEEERWTAHWQAVARHDDPTLLPKISFLVPVHGTEEVLGRCLRSIQQQTLTNIECIVVDDASSGDVAAVLRDTVGDDARFRLVTHATNRGLYQARSTAAAEARGAYLAHVDSDDYIHPRFAEIMLTEAVATDSEIVECQAVELREDGRPIRFNAITNEGPVDGDIAARAFFHNRLRNVVWNKIYARALWQRVPDHDRIDVGLTINEDMLRNALLFPHCRRYSSVKDCLYYYCRRPTSVVKGGNLARLQAKLRDVSFAVSTAKAAQSGPERTTIRRLLDKRQLEDVTWYAAEFLGRHQGAALEQALDGLGPAHDPLLAPLLHLVQTSRAGQDEASALRWALAQEKARADRLEQRLADLRRVIE